MSFYYSKLCTFQAPAILSQFCFSLRTKILMALNIAKYYTIP